MGTDGFHYGALTHIECISHWAMFEFGAIYTKLRFAKMRYETAQILKLVVE